jgi:hypothetical protein
MLFKYLASPRYFFKNGMIRFTQPGGLNDPDDARPQLLYGKHAPEDISAAREHARQRGFGEVSDDVIELFLTPFPAGRFDERSFPGLWPAREPRLRKEPFATLEELDRAIAERAIELCWNFANESIGVLSLTISAGEHMWAYYGGNHSGIALGFQEDHPFFAKAKRMDYSDDPIHVSSNHGWTRVGGIRWATDDILEGTVQDIPEILLFRKRSDWSREQEWRLIRPLAQATVATQETVEGYRLHLFEIPPDALRTVSFGFRASDQDIKWTLGQIDQYLPQFRGVSVSRRRRTKLGTIETESLR